jgi:hypothetical protein
MVIRNYKNLNLWGGILRNTYYYSELAEPVDGSITIIGEHGCPRFGKNKKKRWIKLYYRIGLPEKAYSIKMQLNECQN